ncbi:MAG: hypothetical protein JRF23_04605 [Deltaproteobacteria bacterium]|nr:hypothetical protein [Deltaproteobacteria bacterium]
MGFVGRNQLVRLCRSIARVCGLSKMLVAMLEAELERRREQSATAQWAIELLASPRFKRYLRVTKGKLVRIGRAAIRAPAEYDGKWALSTNDDTI